VCGDTIIAILRNINLELAADRLSNWHWQHFNLPCL